MYICNECNNTFNNPIKMPLECFYGVANDFDYDSKNVVLLCPKCENNDIQEYRREQMGKLEDRTMMNELRKERYASDEEFRARIKKANSKYYQKNKELLYQKHKKYLESHKEMAVKSASESRKRRIEKLRAMGITNPYSVIVGKEPKYKEKED